MSVGEAVSRIEVFMRIWEGLIAEREGVIEQKHDEQNEGEEGQTAQGNGVPR